MIQVNGIDLGKLKERQVIPLPSYDWDGFPGLPSFSLILPYMRMSLLPRGVLEVRPND